MLCIIALTSAFSSAEITERLHEIDGLPLRSRQEFQCQSSATSSRAWGTEDFITSQCFSLLTQRSVLVPSWRASHLLLRATKDLSASKLWAMAETRHGTAWRLSITLKKINILLNFWRDLKGPFGLISNFSADVSKAFENANFSSLLLYFRPPLALITPSERSTKDLDFLPLSTAR